MTASKIPNTRFSKRINYFIKSTLLAIIKLKEFKYHQFKRRKKPSNGKLNFVLTQAIPTVEAKCSLLLSNVLWQFVAKYMYFINCLLFEKYDRKYKNGNEHVSRQVLATPNAKFWQALIRHHANWDQLEFSIYSSSYHNALCKRILFHCEWWWWAHRISHRQRQIHSRKKSHPKNAATQSSNTVFSSFWRLQPKKKNSSKILV